MRISPIALAAALAMSAGSMAVAAPDGGAAKPKPVCLAASDISNRSVVSDQVILFRMNNGTVWKNTLVRACPGLKFEGGFSEEIRGGEICANKQMIQVLRRGTACFLGDFTREEAPKKP